jgi:hypothetical protein
MDQKYDIRRLVAQIALKYHEETGLLEIRRRDLRRLCSENNFHLPTSSFNRAINYLQLRMAFRRIVSKDVKKTMIELYPDNIRRELKEKEIGETHREVQIQEEIWRKVMGEELSASTIDNHIIGSLSNLTDTNKRFCYQLVRKAIFELATEIFSRHFQFYLNDASSDTYRILNERAVKYLWLASKEIALQKQNTSFTIVAQYTGMPKVGHEYKIWTFQIYRTLIPYFVIFVRDCLKKGLNDEQEDLLTAGDYDSLGVEPLKTYWRIFNEVYLSPIMNLYSIPTNS